MIARSALSAAILAAMCYQGTWGQEQTAQHLRDLGVGPSLVIAHGGPLYGVHANISALPKLSVEIEGVVHSERIHMSVGIITQAVAATPESFGLLVGASARTIRIRRSDRAEFNAATVDLQARVTKLIALRRDRMIAGGAEVRAGGVYSSTEVEVSGRMLPVSDTGPFASGLLHVFVSFSRWRLGVEQAVFDTRPEIEKEGTAFRLTLLL